MNRKPLEKEVKADLLKPFTPSKVKGSECFGEGWDPQHKDCAICASIEVCGLLYQQNHIERKKNKFEEEKGPTLDMQDFDSVDLKKIESVALNYQRSGEPMTSEELFNAVSTLAKTKDQIAVREYLKRTLHTTKMTITENQEIHVEDNSSNRSESKS